MSEPQEPSANPAPQIPDPRPWYARSREQLAALIDEVRPEHLGQPTPCTEYDVRALLAHIVGACDRWALLGRGGDGLALEPMATGVPDDAWPAAYDEASGRVADAWAPDALMDAAVTVPWGTTPGRLALTGYIMETATHTWDLARALGVDPGKALDQDVAGFVSGFARKALPPERRGPQIPFAEARAADDQASTYDQLAAWLGRDPAWSADSH
jgi:uncharacterized protein (TIGR03086 family)